jgi:4-oxalocrotonate tautomerase
MPFVTIDHFAGLDRSVRRQLQERLATVVTEAFSAPPDSVRVFTNPIDPADVYVGAGDVETGLPVIRVEFLPGRTLAQKRALVEGLANATADVLGMPAGQIRTILFERTRGEWARGGTLVADMGAGK